MNWQQRLDIELGRSIERLHKWPMHATVVDVRLQDLKGSEFELSLQILGSVGQCNLVAKYELLL